MEDDMKGPVRSDQAVLRGIEMLTVFQRKDSDMVFNFDSMKEFREALAGMLVIADELMHKLAVYGEDPTELRQALALRAASSS